MISKIFYFLELKWSNEQCLQCLNLFEIFLLLSDFLKNQAYEVQAFIKAVQLYRQEKGYYEGWDMLIGNDVQVGAISLPTDF